MTVLAEHVGHRTTLRDERHLRCLDCNRTLVLPAPTATGNSTSTSTSPLPLHHPDACSSHPGQRAGACGPCRAEQLEATTERPAPQPTADVAAGVAAARAALAKAARPGPQAWPCCAHCTGVDDHLGHPPHRLPCQLCPRSA